MSQRTRTITAWAVVNRLHEICSHTSHLKSDIRDAVKSLVEDHPDLKPYRIVRLTGKVGKGRKR